MRKTKNHQYMNYAIAGAPRHMTLRSRATAAIASGCLALAIFPGVAMAAPADGQGPQQNGNPPAMQTGFSDESFGMMAGGGQMLDGQMPGGEAPDGQMPGGQAPDGQAPSGQMPSGGAPSGQMPGDQAPEAQAPEGQMPDGQAPEGQSSNGQPLAGSQRDDPMDDQVRQALSDGYGIETNAPFGGQSGQPGDPADAPEIPEGQANVQQIIDSMRDVFRAFGVDKLESADLTDEEFANQLASFVTKSNEERMQMFASGQRPSDMPQEIEAPDGATQPEQTADGHSAAPASGQAASDELIQNLVSFVMGVFGYTA